MVSPFEVYVPLGSDDLLAHGGELIRCDGLDHEVIQYGPRVKVRFGEVRLPSLHVDDDGGCPGDEV